MNFYLFLCQIIRKRDILVYNFIDMTENSALKLLLQKQITGEQYKIIDDYKKMAQNLQKEHQRTKSNSAKLQQLQKKVACLEFMNSASARQSARYQRKLEKLQSTQNYATQLLKLKYKSFVDMQKQKHQKHEQCFTKRQMMAQNRQLSMSVYDRRKGERIKRIREQQQRISMDIKKKQSQMEAQIQQRKYMTKEREYRMKERRQRYELFKVQRAALNYNEKVQHEIGVLKQQNRYLEELKKRVKKEQEVFRKTQILNKQTMKIESIYLTGNDIQ